MKVCIPCSAGDESAAVLKGNIGTAPYFAVYDTVSRKKSYIKNLNIIDMDSRCNPAGAILSLNVSAVLCAEICGRTVLMLDKFGIKILITGRTYVKDIIESYEKGEYFVRAAGENRPASRVEKTSGSSIMHGIF
jgi:predicted Fe-Mo cluster-binding NifX family protein